MANELRFGHVKLSRKFFRDPLWSESREFSRAEAWIDIVASASFKDGSRKINGIDVHTSRGQLPTAERFLATHWKWSRARVRRFLDVLVTRGAITVATIHANNGGAGKMITLLNYDTYQDSQSVGDSTSSAGDKVKALWAIWIQELGGPAPHPKLTALRSKKVQALWDEQLKGEDDPMSVFRSICVAVKASEHHMGTRMFQLPESLFKNAERRERWAMGVTNAAAGSGFVSRFAKVKAKVAEGEDDGTGERRALRAFYDALGGEDQKRLAAEAKRQSELISASPSESVKASFFYSVIKEVKDAR